jgi:hypothetical protein
MFLFTIHLIYQSENPRRYAHPAPSYSHRTNCQYYIRLKQMSVFEKRMNIGSIECTLYPRRAHELHACTWVVVTRSGQEARRLSPADADVS